MASVVVTDDYSPLYQGDTEVVFAPVFAHKADGSPFPLTGATISMKMQGTDGTVKTCAGTWTIDDAANGKAHYAWQAADVNTAGTWQLYITITIGGLPVHGDVKILQILPII
jgi:hypothetical protein